MSKIRIYVPPQEIANSIRIEDREVIHKLRDVCRLKPDVAVCVFDGQGSEYFFKVQDIMKNYVALGGRKLERKESLPKRRVVLGFPLVKEDRAGFILQKATELGAAAFIPFVCERSINGAPSAEKLRRWHKIVVEAARQCGRLWLPPIEEVVTFEQVCKADYPFKYAGAVDGRRLEKSAGKEGVRFVVVGPVGDWTPAEYEKLAQNNFRFIKLAPNILRVETAAAFAVGLLVYRLTG